MFSPTTIRRRREEREDGCGSDRFQERIEGKIVGGDPAAGLENLLGGGDECGSRSRSLADHDSLEEEKVVSSACWNRRYFSERKIERWERRVERR